MGRSEIVRYKANTEAVFGEKAKKSGIMGQIPGTASIN